MAENETEGPEQSPQQNARAMLAVSRIVAELADCANQGVTFSDDQATQIEDAYATVAPPAPAKAAKTAKAAKS